MKLSNYRVVGPTHQRFGLVQTVQQSIVSSDLEDAPVLSLDPTIPGDALLALQYGFTGWERQLNEYGAIHVLSDWQAERIGQVFGLRTRIERFSVVFDLGEVPTMRRKRGEKLRVLFFAVHADQSRKGADLAKAAFTAAFGHREDVELVIHSTYPAPLLTVNAPNINTAGGQLHGDAYREYLESFDVLLHPARAEVYGITVQEAIASGMPAIHTGATGLEAFGGLSLNCGHRSVRCMDGTEWREPYLDHLVDRLREVDTQYTAVMKRAQRDAKEIHALNIIPLITGENDSSGDEPPSEVSDDGDTHQSSELSHA